MNIEYIAWARSVVAESYIDTPHGKVLTVAGGALKDSLDYIEKLQAERDRYKEALEAERDTLRDALERIVRLTKSSNFPFGEISRIYEARVKECNETAQKALGGSDE